MNKINEFYNIGQINNVSALHVKSVNKLYIIDTEKEKYLLKIYIPKFRESAPLSLSAQDLICRHLGLAPQVIRNRNNELMTHYNRSFFSLQQYISGYNFLLNENTIDIYINAINSLHKLLSKTYKKMLVETKEKELTKYDLEDLVKNSRVKYDTLGIKNTTYEELIDFRYRITKNIQSLSYSVNYKTIIHGDIRPSNIIYDGDSINFIDFDYLSNGDLLYELASSITLLSQFNEQVCRKFWERYNNSQHIPLSFEDLYRHLLSYYLKSSFPLNILSYESKEQIDTMSLERIKLIKFCYKIINP